MSNFKYIAFYKPYGVLSQFTGDEGEKTLRDFGFPSDVYASGRLDKDSEGLLVLTNDGVFIQKISNPNANKEKTYYVQVENIPSENSLNLLRKGLQIKNYVSRPCLASLISPPPIEDRIPPIRFRRNIPTSWLEIRIREGKNRQVRRMTAKIGHPTLRLIRVGIGKLRLSNLLPGEWVYINREEII